MSFAIVQSQVATASGSAASVSATFSSAPTRPNRILVFVGAYGQATLTISDSLSNTYTQIAHEQLETASPAYQTYDIWALDPTTSGQVGSGMTITATPGASTYLSILIVELSFAGSPPATGAIGTGDAGGVAGSDFSCGNVAIPSNSAVFGVVSQLGATVTITPDTSYTALCNVLFSSGSAIGFMTEYLLNTTTNPAAPTASVSGQTTPSWGMIGQAFTEAPIAATGPTSGTVGTASSDFTITPSAAMSATFTPSVSTISGTFTPTTLSWSNSSAAKTFTFTPSSAGTGNISGSFSPGYTIGGLPISFTASSGGGGPTTATLAGPSPASGPVNIQSGAFTVTLNAAAGSGGVVVNLASTGSGDTFQA